ncbi:TPA_asm: hypothetical protein, partial [ssRNA phage Esthiorhiza.2_50]
MCVRSVLPPLLGVVWGVVAQGDRTGSA